MMKISVVGAGLTGSIIARNMADAGYEVTVYEKRDHIAGNVYDYEHNGILIHKYGPHIFHTSKENVNDYMSRFWKLNDFKNVVEGYVDNKLIPIPFNFKSIDLLFPNEAEIIKNKLLERYPNQDTVPILELIKVEDEIIKKVAMFVYENVFMNYTTKMWGLKPDEIDKSVTARIPIVLSYRNTYFKDKYEGLPVDGYTKAVERILDHKNITVKLNTDVNKMITLSNEKVLINNEETIVIYTGPIDKLFSEKYGSLEYRSLFFVFETLNKTKFQDTAVVNYPADPTMTRITEYKNMTFQKCENKTVISKEYPGNFDEKSPKWNEPYYPLATDKAREQYEKYSDFAKKFTNLFICGRMALYKYINMDQAIDKALNLSKVILEYAKSK